MCTASRFGLSNVAAIAAAMSTACQEPAPPWAGEPDGKVIDESEPFLPSRRPIALADEDAGGGGGDLEDAPLPEEEILARPAGRHGGLWMSCHDRFAVSGEPRRDATRLALSCGPVTGMRRASDLITGRLEEGARSGHRFAGEAGHCYRIFVAAADGIASLDVRVADGRGEVVARHTSTSPWAAVEPERPFCVVEATPLTVSIAARGGAGAFAAEVWSIPPRQTAP